MIRFPDLFGHKKAAARRAILTAKAELTAALARRDTRRQNAAYERLKAATTQALRVGA